MSQGLGGGLGKLGDKRSRIADHDAASIQAMDAGRWLAQAHAGLCVPTLAQVLEAFAGRTHLCVEIKLTETGEAARHHELCETVAAMLSDMENISVLSFHEEALEWVRAAQPGLALVRNVDTPNALGSVAARRGHYAAVDFGIRRFGMRHRGQLQHLGLPLHSYTCDSRCQLRKALDLGVSRIITNYPARSRAWVAELLAEGRSAV